MSEIKHKRLSKQLMTLLNRQNKKEDKSRDKHKENINKENKTWMSKLNKQKMLLKQPKILSKIKFIKQKTLSSEKEK